MWTIRTIWESTLDVLFPKYCYICKKDGYLLCENCTKIFRKTLYVHPPHTISVYSFKDPNIKRIIHAIKYFKRRDLVLPMTDILAEEMLTKNWSGVLVPIPMPKVRLFLRGYNQAEIIAKCLSKKCNLQMSTDILSRTTSPKRQAMAKNRNERIHNQLGSFRVTKEIGNLDIILVDDVTTTGGTLNEARKVLLQAGANSVHAVTIAH